MLPGVSAETDKGYKVWLVCALKLVSARGGHGDVNMKNMKKFWVSFIICSICTIVMAWLRGVFEQTSPVYVFHILSDCFLIVGILAACIALLLFVSNEGTFDIFVYGMQSFWGFFRNDRPGKYDTFYDYRMARQEKKVPFLFLLACGGIFLLMSVLMYGGYCIYL